MARERPFGSLAAVAAGAAIFVLVLFICTVLVFRSDSISQRVVGSVLLSAAVALIATDPVLRLFAHRGRRPPPT
jgi:multisubunit Na+/H+ antiporter MnhF subunit